MQFAFREAFNPITGVTEQHAAGAVAIHQHGDQFLTRFQLSFAVAVGNLQQRLDVLLADQIVDPVHLRLGDRFIRQQRGNGIGDGAEMLLLFNKGGKVMETVRVEQAQTGEVTLHAQLLWRRGQQQNPGSFFSQLFNNLIFTAWLAF